MTEELDLDLTQEEQPRRWRFDWILPTFLRPRRTFVQIAEQEKPAWLLPMLLLSLLILINILVVGPVRREAALMNMSGELPPGYEWWLPEEQARYQETISKSAGFFSIYVTPLLGSLGGLWIAWFLLGSILHLGLTLGGSRSSNTSALNLTAWASLPLGVRILVQTIAVLASRSLVKTPGLSGFAAAEPAGFSAFLAALLALIDIYLIWQFVLLLVGVVPMAGIARGKAWIITAIVFLLILALRALPGFIGMQLSGLNTGGGFFYF
ncbi:MAG TPA: YIP1 family protein [Anaerolineaceae bacterium]|nr:YIP1 family protein [Anaerolineaceae bacterium]